MYMKLCSPPISTLLLFIVLSFYNCKEFKTGQAVPSEMVYPDSVYIKMGKTIAQEAQSILAKNLMNAISKGGTEYAVEFCNTRAILLTDSMAHLLNTGIKRVSDRPRNQSNQAQEYEQDYINLLRDKMKIGEKPEPMVKEIDGKKVGLYPIITNPLCLQCHGNTVTNINSTTLEKIKKLYPADKATGYGDNELRGLWVIEMKKK